MNDEFNNKNGSEFNSQVESKTIKENIFALENKPVSENIPVKENLETVGQTNTKSKSLRKEKQNKALSVMSAGLVGAVGTVVFGMTNLVNVKMNADFKEVEARDGVIAYSINVQDMSEKEKLTLYPQKDNVKLEAIPLVDEDGDGLIQGEIKIDVDYISEHISDREVVYTLQLKGVVGLGVERSFDEYQVKFENVLVSKFDSVEGECRCSIDGYYHFTMNFVDDKGLFTDFEAYIEDDFKNRSTCTFTNNLHEEQKIFVETLNGSHGKLVIKYNAEGVETYVKGESGSNWIDINM